MKLMVFFLISSAFAMAVSAADYSDKYFLRFDVAEFPSHKVCIYKNELYSEGSEIKMESQKYYRCERYQQGKTTHKSDVQLRWVAISPGN